MELVEPDTLGVESTVTVGYDTTAVVAGLGFSLSGRCSFDPPRNHSKNYFTEMASVTRPATERSG